MIKKKLARIFCIVLLLLVAITMGSCGSSDGEISELSQLDGQVFAVPTGTVADQLVLSKIPNAQFQYYNNVFDACLAVKSGKAAAAAYDEPILRNIAAKTEGLYVLPEMITENNYAFAVQLDNQELKTAIDKVINDVKSNSTYDDMLKRWLPETGAPAAMPEILLTGDNGILRFGTAAITEPFSFVDGSHEEVGFDIELAAYVAQELGMELEIVDLDFGSLIPALASGKVDMIGACLTITEERAKSVLFSEPYYEGGIAALVKK